MSLEQPADDDDDVKQPKIVVSDPEDFAKTRQLRSIFDARDSYLDARRSANRAAEDSEIDFETKNRRIYRHMQDFAMAVEPLIRRHDAGDRIWSEKKYELDRVWIRGSEIVDRETAIENCRTGMPGLYQEWVDVNNNDRWGSNLDKKKRVLDDMKFAASDTGVVFCGINEIVERIPKLAYYTDSRGTKTSPPPQRLSDEVFRDLQNFIDEIGLGFDIQSEQQTKIDDDVLEEVNQWRQENI